MPFQILLIIFLVVVFGYGRISNVRKESSYLKELRQLGVEPVATRDYLQVVGVGYVTELLFVDETKGNIDDQVLGNVNNLRNLVNLDLSDTKVTDETLVKLEQLKCLTELNLSGTAISDKGVESIIRIPRLKKVNISDTKISRDRFFNLKRKLPDLEIIWY